jgi:hypothetical protein
MSTKALGRPRRGARRLVMGTSVWWWYSKGKGIEIWSPQGKRQVTDASTVTGRTWEAIERGYWKKTSDCSVTPGHIRAFIEKTKTL